MTIKEYAASLDSAIEEDTFSVVIIGGGYAGTIAANRFWGSLTDAERSRAQVTIINPVDLFVHRIRLHEHAAGISDATLTLRSMVHAETRLVIGRAQWIDAPARSVHVETASGGIDVAYDRLIYAVGSRSATHVRGVREHAVPIGDVDGANGIAVRLERTDVRSVCVVGGGPTGVETAAELAEAHPSVHITLVAGDMLVAGLRTSARRSIRRSLERLGVTVVEQGHVAEVTPRGICMSDQAEYEVDLVIWAPGFEVPDLAARSGLPVDERGRLLVDDALRCIAEPTILGAGDASGFPMQWVRTFRWALARRCRSAERPLIPRSPISEAYPPEPSRWGFSGRRSASVDETGTSSWPESMIPRRRLRSPADSGQRSRRGCVG
jgi:NADH dehydrogenase FAD-containing subunit